MTLSRGPPPARCANRFGRTVQSSPYPRHCAWRPPMNVLFINNDGSVLEPLENSLRALGHTAERLGKAHRAGLMMAVAPLRDRWDWQLRSAQDLLTRLRRDAMPARPRRTDLSAWVAELRQAEDEF